MNHLPENPLSPLEALAALQWLAEAGVDDTVEETPADWYGFDAAPPPKPVVQIHATVEQTKAPVTVAPPIYASQSTSTLIAAARSAADACKTLEELREAIASFEGCALKKLATNMVFADGNAESGLMLVGDAPDTDDDREGMPFTGICGKLLDKMFLAIGKTREDFYVTNSIFWRPPGNRAPSADEISICLPFVEKHIALVNPKHLVLVGGVAAQTLLATSEGISRLRIKRHEYTNVYISKPIPTSVLFHPSYLLRQPSHKALAWRDLLAIKAAFGE